ncbi:MAG: phospho-N-acetylmuramoyl-pentapeptide-transferase [Lachnospiraceae bacterium]|nr:phospho-N-acetylmuramoyl-pentapeptide-transferase [Lachnospiraceae bacterium]
MSDIQTYVLAGFAGFIISVIAGHFLIPVLQRIKAGQTEREDGPKSHLAKTGTPTMGGFIFLISATLVCAFFAVKETSIIPVILLTWAFAGVGFIDDFIKVVLKRSEGLSAKQKMALQIVVALAFVLWLNFGAGYEFLPLIPFAGGKTVSVGIWSVPIAVFIIVGTVNGSNFTDGVDGLEASVTIAIIGFFLLVSVVAHITSVTAVSVGFIGALCGFLVFNVNKARVFMGDTGSLALGGLVSGLALMLHMELYLPIIALIYFAEVLSVIIQVLYFKATHGKRIFRMAPIHHHFELGGWSETKVVYIFTIVTVILCFAAFAFM